MYIENTCYTNVVLKMSYTDRNLSQQMGAIETGGGGEPLYVQNTEDKRRKKRSKGNEWEGSRLIPKWNPTNTRNIFKVLARRHGDIH